MLGKQLKSHMEDKFGRERGGEVVGESMGTMLKNYQPQVINALGMPLFFAELSDFSTFVTLAANLLVSSYIDLHYQNQQNCCRLVGTSDCLQVNQRAV